MLLFMLNFLYGFEMKVPLRLVGLYSIFLANTCGHFAAAKMLTVMERLTANGNGNGANNTNINSTERRKCNTFPFALPLCKFPFVLLAFVPVISWPLFEQRQKKNHKKKTQKIMWSARERNNNNKMWEKWGNTRNYQHQHKHKQSARRIYNGKVNKLTSRARLLSR